MVHNVTEEMTRVRKQAKATKSNRNGEFGREMECERKRASDKRTSVQPKSFDVRLFRGKNFMTCQRCHGCVLRRVAQLLSVDTQAHALQIRLNGVDWLEISYWSRCGPQRALIIPEIDCAAVTANRYAVQPNNLQKM